MTTNEAEASLDGGREVASGTAEQRNEIRWRRKGGHESEEEENRVEGSIASVAFHYTLVSGRRDDSITCFGSRGLLIHS